MKRIIKEYEQFESGSSYYELYRGIEEKGDHEQFIIEMKEIDYLSTMLENKNVGSFRLIFKEGKLEQSIKNEIDLKEISREFSLN